MVIGAINIVMEVAISIIPAPTPIILAVCAFSKFIANTRAPKVSAVPAKPCANVRKSIAPNILIGTVSIVTAAANPIRLPTTPLSIGFTSPSLLTENVNIASVAPTAIVEAARLPNGNSAKLFIAPVTKRNDIPILNNALGVLSSSSTPSNIFIVLARTTSEVPSDIVAAANDPVSIPLNFLSDDDSTIREAARLNILTPSPVPIAFVAFVIINSEVPNPIRAVDNCAPSRLPITVSAPASEINATDVFISGPASIVTREPTPS